MIKTLANAWKTADLRKKILFTLMIILLYRVGACITVPFISYAGLEQMTFFGIAIAPSQSIFGDMGATGLVSMMSGNAFSQATLFALGVQPYITASIVMQLLAVAIPPLERLAKSEDGKEKINSITRYVTILLALVSSIGYYLMLKSANAVYEKGFFFAVVIVACFCAGSSLVMWLAEKINEFGIGNGISIILFANIVSRAPSLFLSLYSMIASPLQADKIVAGDVIGSILYAVLMSAFVLFLVWFIIFISDSERRIPVQYAKKVVGRKMYGGQNTNLPIKLNMTGVMPVIFASTILNLPATLNYFLNGKKWWQSFYTLWNGGLNPVSIILNLICILAFAYFYVAISFNPVEVAGNLQKNGGSIPGIRPGKPTSDFIKKVLSKITFIGALALAVVAVVPTIIQYIINVCGSTLMIQDYVFAGTSIIIVVGVILETVKEIETQLSMRHYKGFLE